MKKLASMLVLCLVIYMIYHDITKGTLPTAAEIKTVHVHSTKTKAKINISYQIIKVQAGDTLLSIVEKQQNAPLSVSIEQLIKDFEALNPGTQAESLQIGKTYKFPVYNR
jgi:hypothetical protein